MLANISLRSRLADAVDAVDRDFDPTMGLTTDEAKALRDEIVDADLTDDDALRAHDMLHHRVVFGRSF
jgi:hypothetical protein